MKLEYKSPKVECVEFGSKDVLTPSDPDCRAYCPNYGCDNYEEGFGCQHNPAWCPDD